MSTIKLRKYQEESLEKIKQLLDFECPVKAYCLVLPTGAGKSVIIAAFIDYVLKEYERDTLSVLVVSWSRQIVSQDKRALMDFTDVEDFQRNVDFSTVQSLRNFKPEKKYDIIIVDECHKMYVGTAGYSDIVSRMIRTNGCLRNGRSDTLVLGVTATPYRNKHECVIGDKEMFVGVEQLVTYSRLIDEGFLVKPVYEKCALFSYECDGLELNSIGDFSTESMEKQCKKYSNAIARAVVNVHDRKCKVPNKCTLVFLPSLHSCELVLREILEETKRKWLRRPLRIDMIEGKTIEDDRKEITSNADIILNCGVLTTGVDIPRVASIVVCRATKSNTLWKQIVGRGLRLCENKTKCEIIDCGGNVERFGDDLDAEPSLSTKHITQLPVMSECPHCKHYVHTNCKCCKYCGKELRTDEQIRMMELQRIYFEGGMLPVEDYKEQTVHLPEKGIRRVITVKFSVGKNRTFTFSNHPFSMQKYEEYKEVLEHCRNKKEILFLKVEERKGFETIVDAKVLDKF